MSPATDKVYRSVYRFTKDEYLTMISDRYTWKSIFFKMRYAMILGVFFSMTLFVMSRESETPDFSWLFVLLVFLLTPVFLRRLIPKVAIKKFDVRQDANKEIALTMDGRGVLIEVQGLGESRLEWDKFLRAGTSDKGIKLYMSIDHYYWFSRAGVESFEEYEKACAFIQEKFPVDY